MKKLLVKLSAAAIGLFAMSTANADQLADNCYPPSGCCPTSYYPCCDDYFSGFYVGGNVGAIDFHSHTTDRDAFLVGAATYSATDINVVAGVQLGYDWSCGSKLFGLVADWDWTNADTNTHLSTVTPGLTQRLENEIRWFSTLRARAGIVVCDSLVYITAGAVAAHFRHRIENSEAVNPTSTFDNTRWGWTAGLGFEWIFCRSWSLNAEVLWLGFNQHRETHTSDGTDFEFDFSHHAWIGRVGVNYRFGNWCWW
jgi:outer membrane immunogenic protein